MKIALKVFGGLVGLVFALIIVAGVVLMLVVDREFIQDRMRDALNRHVTIESIDVGIFSALSGIEVRNVAISNYKDQRQLEILKDKPVPSRDVFVSLKSFTFKVALLPLLEKRVQLKELLLREPKINVIKYTSGAYNYSDLTRPKPLTAEEKEKALKQKQEAAKKPKEEPQKPLSADDIPVAITVGKIGIEKGELSYLDMNYNQTFQAYNLTVLAHSIDIDPQALEKHDSMKLDLDFGLKTMGPMSSGSVKSFDIGFSLRADVRPFDLKTRLLDPEVTMQAGMPYGSLTGLQIFDKLKSIEALTRYIGRVSFLKETVTWKDAFVKAWYKGGTVKLEDGTVKTEDFNLEYAGRVNVNTKNTDLRLDMVLAEKYDAEVRAGIEANVKKVLTGNLARVVKPEAVVTEAMKPLVNDTGRIFLSYLVTGPLNKPDAKLVHPKLPSLEDVAKRAAGSAADALKDAAEKEAARAVDTAKEKATDEATKQADKGVKSIKKKLKF
jgi:hypothetical protein